MDTKTFRLNMTFAYSVWCLVCLLSLSGNLHSQVLTGSIVGRVSDQSGATVPGAHVVATDTGTGYHRETTTAEGGLYSMPALPYGVYILEVSASGFKRVKQGPMTLNSTQQLSVNVLLTPGTVQETVDVVGEVQSLQTEESATKAQVYLDQVDNLPLNSRSPFELGLLGPSIQTNHQQSGPSVQYTINGQNVNGYKLMFDGMEAGIGGDAQYFAGNNFNLSVTSVDAIQEFDLETGNYSADTKGSSGYVNIVSKTGTNQLHGDFYDFFRNGVLDASNFFAVTKGDLKQNDFGATVTGPIKLNKIFFMGSYEGQRIHLPYPGVAFVPTAAFRATVDPRLSPFLNLTPLPSEPTGNPDIGTYAANVLSVTSQDLVTGRVDINFSEKDRLFVAYTWNGGRLHGGVATTGNGAAIFPGTDNSQPETHQNAIVGWNHNFSPTFLNDFNIGLNRYLQGRRIGPTNATEFGLPLLTVPGLTIQGGGNTKKLGNTQPQLTDKVTWVKGKSTLSFGGNYIYLRSGQAQSEYIDMSFPTLAAFAADAPDALNSTFGTTGYTLPEHLHYNQVGLFVQEDYRATPKLTLNLGLRYDNFGVFKDSVPNYAYNISTSDPFSAFSAPGAQLYNSNNDFGPRVGFAWQPKSGSVVRGGFGMFYGTHVSGQEGDVLGLNSVHPFSITTADFSDLSYPFNPALLVQANTTLGRFELDPNSKDLYTEQWNLTIEHQFGLGALLTLGYIGNHSVHVPGSLLPNNFNPLIGTRVDPNFGSINEVINQYNDHYNALQASVRRRLTHDLAFDVSYAWGHTTGLESGFYQVSSAVSFGSDQIQAYGPPPYNLRNLSRGTLANDVRNNFSADFIYQLPRLADANGFVKNVFGGWTTSGIIQASTGAPFNVTTGGDTGDETFNQFPNLVPGVPLYLSGRTPATGFLNPAAFSIPTAVDPSSGLILGDLADNTTKMPANFTFDYMIGKRLASTERFKFDFRAEFFNIFNHPIFGFPTANLSAGSLFGISTTASDPREIQLMLRVSF